MSNHYSYPTSPTAGRPRNVTDTEFRSRQRRQLAFEDLKIRVERLPSNILENLLARVAQPPTTRPNLVQAQIYGVSALIVDEYAMLLQMISQLQAEKENAQRQIAQLLAQIQGTNVAYNNFGYSSM